MVEIIVWFKKLVIWLFCGKLKIECLYFIMDFIFMFDLVWLVFI